jgi:hypothetical protein
VLNLILHYPLFVAVQWYCFVGILYKDDCKYQKYIPIYLIIGGSFGVMRTLWMLYQRTCQRNDENEEDGDRKQMNPLEMLLNCFMLAWFITGSVWIFSIYTSYQSDDKTKHNYCNEVLYLYAFWITNATYMLLASICCCACCLFICAMMMG